MNPLPVYDDRYIETKIRTYGDNVYTNFRGLIVPEDGVEVESFKITSIDSLLVYEKKISSTSILENCTYKTLNTQLIDCFDDNLLRLMKISFIIYIIQQD